MKAVMLVKDVGMLMCSLVGRGVDGGDNVIYSFMVVDVLVAMAM